MKTREEVEALKSQWLLDPYWDIEDTPNFGEYAVELAGFAVEHRGKWREAREKAEALAYLNTPASEMTLRDMFAAHALLAYLATDSANIIAADCYRVADAMMKARKNLPAAGVAESVEEARQTNGLQISRIFKQGY